MNELAEQLADMVAAAHRAGPIVEAGGPIPPDVMRALHRAKAIVGAPLPVATSGLALHLALVRAYAFHDKPGSN